MFVVQFELPLFQVLSVKLKKGKYRNVNAALSTGGIISSFSPQK